MKKLSSLQAIPETATSLTFRRGTNVRYVVTDGLHHAIYSEDSRKFYPTLSRAIAHLEATGYTIVVDMFFD